VVVDFLVEVGIGRLIGARVQYMFVTWEMARGVLGRKWVMSECPPWEICKYFGRVFSSIVDKSKIRRRYIGLRILYRRRFYFCGKFQGSP
jgi:hypothetical protein